MTKRTFPLIASALVLALAACGGDGGGDYAAKLRGDAPTAAMQFTPQPTPIPPPTALPVPTQLPPTAIPTPPPVVLAIPPTQPPPPINPEPAATPVGQAVLPMPNVEPYPADSTGCYKDAAGIWVCP